MTKEPGQLNWDADEGDDGEAEAGLDLSQPDADALQKELDDLLSPAPATPTISTGIDDLDELLTESLVMAAEIKAAKEARSRIARGRANKDDAGIVQAWNAKYEWKAVANGGLFLRYRCACGNVQTVFEGLMLHQQHARNAATSRWTQADRITPGLHVETIVREKAVEMCGACVGRHGSWTLDAPTLWRA